MRRLKIYLISSLAVLAVVALIVLFSKVLSGKKTDQKTSNNKVSSTVKNTQASTEQEKKVVIDSFLLSDNINRQYLTVNPYSRPGTALKQVNAVVIHYVGNPGTTAEQNRNYFESLKDTHTTSASSHYIVGLEGEIIQCVPLEEVSYASNNRNSDTIAIENCHPDDSGRFNEQTYRSLVKLTAALLKSYSLNTDTGLIRHYDVTGKECPRYYVVNEEEWYAFKLSVEAAMKEL